jgi:cysteine desulfurase/selenocysteine lyase
VAFSHVSNAVGTLNPVRDIAAIARSVGALVVCDGAQGAPHLRVGFDELDVDFYAFSGHKMCGPMGIGGLIGRRAILEAMSPYQFGGDMIEFVRDDHSTWNVLPHKFEAGTPNVADAWDWPRHASTSMRSAWTTCWRMSVRSFGSRQSG